MERCILAFPSGEGGPTARLVDEEKPNNTIY